MHCFFAVLYLAVLTLGFEIRDFEKVKDLILLIVNIFCCFPVAQPTAFAVSVSAGVYFTLWFSSLRASYISASAQWGPLARRLRIPMLLLCCLSFFVAFLRREHWFAAFAYFYCMAFWNIGPFSSDIGFPRILSSRFDWLKVGAVCAIMLCNFHYFLFSFVPFIHFSQVKSIS